MRKIVVIVSMLIPFLQSCSQRRDPMGLAKRIFDGKGFPELTRYVKGEYKGSPNGQDMDPRLQKKFLLLGQNDSTAVVNMTIMDSPGKGMDTYLHFEKDTVWKMKAFRALAMTGILAEMEAQLEAISPSEVDTIIENTKKGIPNKYKIALDSREEYAFELGNTRLTLALDDSIIQHFRSHQKEFEDLLARVLKEKKTEMPDGRRSVDMAEGLKADYRKLFISSIQLDEGEFEGCIVFTIGGMLDNTVGYIYVKDKKNVPVMSPSPIIMIREIGNGWYLYKTT